MPWANAAAAADAGEVESSCRAGDEMMEVGRPPHTVGNLGEEAGPRLSGCVGARRCRAWESSPELLSLHGWEMMQRKAQNQMSKSRGKRREVSSAGDGEVSQGQARSVRQDKVRTKQASNQAHDKVAAAALPWAASTIHEVGAGQLRPPWPLKPPKKPLKPPSASSASAHVTSVIQWSELHSAWDAAYDDLLRELWRTWVP